MLVFTRSLDEDDDRAPNAGARSPLTHWVSLPEGCLPKFCLNCFLLRGITCVTSSRGKRSELRQFGGMPFDSFGCSFFAYSRKLPPYSGTFLHTVVFGSFLTYNWNLFTYNWSFFAYSGKVHLISTITDCKQGRSTARKETPPFIF